MNTRDVSAFCKAAHECAQVMAETATYIRRELPNVDLDTDLRAATNRVCYGLAGTRYDIVHEVAELDDLLESESFDSDVLSRVERMIRWLCDDVSNMQQLVTTLESACKRNSALMLGYVLIMESATNVLRAFTDAKAIADRLLTRS